MMLPPLQLLLPALFVGGIISTLGGGGLGIVLVIIGSFFLPIDENVALTSLLAIVIHFSKMFHFRGHIRKDIALWYTIPGIPLSYVGGLLLFTIPNRLLEVSIGALCILMATKEMIPFFKRKHYVEPSHRNLLVFGAVNGFLGGLIGNASIIRGPALLSMGLRKEEFIGTSTVIALVLNLSKGAAYAQSLTWSTELGMLFLWSIPVLVIGVAIGKRLLKYVSTGVFEWLQHGIMLLGALRLLFS